MCVCVCECLCVREMKFHGTLFPFQHFPTEVIREGMQQNRERKEREGWRGREGEGVAKGRRVRVEGREGEGREG